MPNILFVGQMGCVLWPIRRQKGKKSEKRPWKRQKWKFWKTKKDFFPIAIKTIFSKNKVAVLKIVNCSVLTDKQTEKQRQRQSFQGFRSSSLQSVIKERSNFRHIKNWHTLRGIYISANTFFVWFIYRPPPWWQAPFGMSKKTRNCFI